MKQANHQRMPEVNHLYTAEKLLFVVKRIRNGGVMYWGSVRVYSGLWSSPPKQSEYSFCKGERSALEWIRNHYANWNNQLQMSTTLSGSLLFAVEKPVNMQSIDHWNNVFCIFNYWWSHFEYGYIKKINPIVPKQYLQQSPIIARCGPVSYYIWGSRYAYNSVAPGSFPKRNNIWIVMWKGLT